MPDEPVPDPDCIASDVPVFVVAPVSGRVASNVPVPVFPEPDRVTSELLVPVVVSDPDMPDPLIPEEPEVLAGGRAESDAPVPGISEPDMPAPELPYAGFVVSDVLAPDVPELDIPGPAVCPWATPANNNAVVTAAAGMAFINDFFDINFLYASKGLLNKVRPTKCLARAQIRLVKGVHALHQKGTQSFVGLQPNAISNQ